LNNLPTIEGDQAARFWKRHRRGRFLREAVTAMSKRPLPRQWLQRADQGGSLGSFFKSPLTAEERDVAAIEG